MTYSTFENEISTRGPFFGDMCPPADLDCLEVFGQPSHIVRHSPQISEMMQMSPSKNRQFICLWIHFWDKLVLWCCRCKSILSRRNLACNPSVLEVRVHCKLLQTGWFVLAWVAQLWRQAVIIQWNCSRWLVVHVSKAHTDYIYSGRLSGSVIPPHNQWEDSHL